MTEKEGNFIYDIEELVYRYPQGRRDVLCGANLRLKQGEVMTLLGPNGSGKSTLLDLMAGLAEPSGGSIKLADRPLSEYSPRDRAGIVAYVPQNHHPAFSYTVFDFVLMGRAPHMGILARPSESDRKKASAAIDDMGMSHLAEHYYTQISGGERQLAVIARALCQEPSVILFDEPTSHLDYGNQYRTLSLIRDFSKKGYSAVITTHNPDHALLLGGDVAILGRDGRISSGAANEMITEERMRDIYDIDVRIVFSEEAGRVCCIAPGLDGR